MVAQETFKKVSAGNKVGLDDKSINEIYSITSHILADIQALYIKTRGFHWNLEDPRFYFLHELFEDHYEELEEESDMVAERLRQLGRQAPGSFEEFKRLMSLKEVNDVLSGDQMIEALVSDHELLIRNMRQAIDSTTNMLDFGTADMFTEIMRKFDKRAWMLRSHLQ
jgi:starvation-inducible DNA-binding protein